ncbi:MAG: DUF3551 domain-containing protein [Hyphomicrobiales bacterium]|nr:DUF3551 domain-containing protein [Hyphomicrobiales bacterium]
MRNLTGGLVLMAALTAAGSSAQAAPWCAFYDASTYNCGFHSYQQCLATISGVGGICRQNFFEGNGGAAPPKRRQRNRQYQ